MRRSLGDRFGKLQVREKSFARVGVEMARANDFSATSTREDFTRDLKFLPASPKFWAGREGPLSTDESKMCRRKSGELLWVATVSRPEIRARLGETVSRIGSLCRSDVYRINDLARAAKEWRETTALKYASCF